MFFGTKHFKVKNENKKVYFEKYLMLKIAPVLVKVKPASLLGMFSYPICSCDTHYYLWNRYKKDIAKTLKISFKELKNSYFRTQVLFYDFYMLSEIINQRQNQMYLNQCGYFSCRSLDDYINMLQVHFNSGSFPHEIGIFLGYPLKDVKGFMEKGSMPLTYMDRWQVFGDTKESLKLMQIHKKAESVFLKFIENQINPLSFIERLSRHFKKAKDIIAIEVL